MQNPDNFEIKYWAGGNDFTLKTNNKVRSVKKKFFIVFAFVGILAIIPVLIYGLSYLQDLNTQKIATTSESAAIKKVVPIKTEGPKVIETEVLNNDSYYKITKRICGSGKQYLSVKDQNNGKALYKGDFVTVDCSL